MIPLTAERAPSIPAGMRAAANTTARTGEIVILGRAAPWNERSGSHNERFMPNAFGLAPNAPLLLAEHTTQTRDGGEPVVMATGAFAENTTAPRSIDGYGTGGGLDCMWILNSDLEAVDWLFSEHLADGNAGLSVEMRVYDDAYVYESWRHPRVRHIKDATVHAVAVVPTPSYMGALIAAIVTPEVSWYRHPRAGVLVPDVEPGMMTTVHKFDFLNARDRIERHGDRAAATQPISAPEPAADARESRYGRTRPPLELR